MRRLLKFFALLGFLVAGSSSAHALTVSEQISAAISAGDFATVQSLVTSNPAAADQAVNGLLDLAKSDLPAKADQASKAMGLALALSGGVSLGAAKGIAEKIAGVVGSALAPCHEQSGFSCTPSPEIAQILNAAQEMSKNPAIVAGDPKLFSEITTQLAQSNVKTGPNGNVVDTQLAQFPGFRNFPHFNFFKQFFPPFHPPFHHNPSGN